MALKSQNNVKHAGFRWVFFRNFDRNPDKYFSFREGAAHTIVVEMCVVALSSLPNAKAGPPGSDRGSVGAL